MTPVMRTPMNDQARAPSILIVDDDPNNLAIMTDYLGGYNYNILVAEDGESGVRRAVFATPDLILLDVMMPGIDGYEACRKLKTIESTRDTPVIFMTALADTENKIKGFEAGAVDYITKPFQREEVLARVGVHLHIRELTNKLQEANLYLEKRVEERTVELRDSERRLTDIINFLPDSTFAVNIAGEVILWNRTAEEFTGVTAEKMLGKGGQEYSLALYGVRRPALVDLVLDPSRESDGLYHYLRRERHTVIGESFSCKMPRGPVYMLGVAAPLYDATGAVVGAIESVHDITARRKAEIALRDSERLRFQMEAELVYAAKIQASLLPHRYPQIAGFEIAARCVPAKQVGGDFFDWEELGHGVLALTLGDVMGKGVAAAMLMATVRATIRSVSRHNRPGMVMRQAERALLSDLQAAESFVTLFHGQLDAAEHTIRFVDCGHGFVFMCRRNGLVEELSPRDLPLGVPVPKLFTEGTVHFEKGDVLVVYSDGLIDARPDLALDNNVLATYLGGVTSSQGMVDRLICLAISEGQQIDDVTVLVVRYTG